MYYCGWNCSPYRDGFSAAFSLAGEPSALIELGIEFTIRCTSSILGSRRLFFDYSQVCAVAGPLVIGVGRPVQEAEGAAKTLGTLDLTLDGGPGKNERSSWA